jgi:ABC-type uncharacterized transport system substrate-binding protein
MHIRDILAALLATCAIAAPAAAHPHIFIEERVGVLFEPAGIAGVRLDWTFDELYSASLRQDYTSAATGPLGTKDVERLHDGAFVHLAKVHYFTTVTLDGTPLKLGEPKDFKARFENGKMIYEFVLPFAAPLPAAGQALEIAVFDPEYYVDFELAEREPVALDGPAAGIACQGGMVKRETVGWGRVDTDVVTCARGR